jgi:hypothetical protein
MPVHIEEMTSEVEAVTGDLPLSAAQIEKLVSLVIKRIEARKRESESQDAATRLRPSATAGGGERSGSSG